MKKILFLLLPLAPALALAQTGTVKDSVRVLTTAEISAGNTPADTSHFYYIEGGSWKKVRMDSIARVARLKLAGNRGDVTVSSDGLTWDLNSGVVDSMQLSAGAVVLPGAKVTGTLPVSKGGTGSETQNFVDLTTTQSIGGVKTFTSELTATKLNVTDSIQSNSGIYKINSSTLGLNVDNTTPFRITNTGNWGIYNDNPQNLLSTFSSSARGGVISSLYPILMFNEVGNSKFVFGLDANEGYLWGFANVKLIISTNNTEKMRIETSGEVNIGYGATDNGAYPLQVNGQIFATNATIATSDEKFKENITPLNKGLEIVNKLKPVTFNFISDTENNFSEYEEVGFIAQDVDRALSTETFAKSIVKSADDSEPTSTMGLATQNLIPILVKAIQEQQALIKALEQRILTLENK